MLEVFAQTVLLPLIAAGVGGPLVQIDHLNETPSRELKAETE
jgi:hypothetical protein